MNFFLKSAAGHLQVTMELMVDDSLKLIIAIIRNIQEENHRKMIHGRIFSIVMFENAAKICSCFINLNNKPCIFPAQLQRVSNGGGC